jgi:Ca2+-binding EF-hand superfamily protein
MANQTVLWRTTLVTAVIAAVVSVGSQELVVAQDNGNRSADSQPDRGERLGRGWRRGGRPGEGRGRNRERGDSDLPEQLRPAPPVTPPAAAAPAKTSFGTVSVAESIRKSATETIKHHDKSGNGILEGDELKDLGMSRSADSDGDGMITHDELVAYRTPKSGSAVAAKASTSPATNAGGASDESIERKIVNNKRKSYRFKTTNERIASWRFASKDANGDGQVSMSEYSSSWSDRTAAEFQRYDHDNDGMITSDEVK